MKIVHGWPWPSILTKIKTTKLTHGKGKFCKKKMYRKKDMISKLESYKLLYVYVT